MGKADNIKRARRLVEAKRKRDLDLSIAVGLGPAGIVLQKRAALNGSEMKINQTGIKYSELLKAFVHPFIEETDDITVVKSKFALGVVAWNAAVMRERSEDDYQSAKKEISDMMSDVPEVERFFEEMVKHKRKAFSKYKNIIADFEIKKIHGIDYNLTVAIIPLEDL